MKIPERNLRSVGDRSLSFIAPTVWNSQPASLRNLPTLSDFKAQLQTFLFQQAFPQIEADDEECVKIGVNYVYVCVYICVKGVC